MESGLHCGLWFDLDAAFASAVQRDPRLERLRAEVELYRYGVRKARGDVPPELRKQGPGRKSVGASPTIPP